MYVKLPFSNFLLYNLHQRVRLEQARILGPRFDLSRGAGSQTARMATLSMDKKDNSIVPTIDISPFLHDPNAPSVTRIVETIHRACVQTGFFQITGHGLSDEVQKGLFQASRRFFALPMEDKLRLDARTQIGRRGYDVLESQTYHADVLPDLKEVRVFPHDMQGTVTSFFVLTM